MRRARILVVDDDPSTLDTIRRNLTKRGFEVCTAATSAEALRALELRPEVVLLDRALSDLDGPELLARARHQDAPPTVVMLPDHGDGDTASSRPLRCESVAEIVARALEHRTSASDEPPEHPALAEIVGRAPSLQRAKLILRRIATSPASTVLITGESGTGKDLAAKAIHACSDRAKGPFINVTCSALPSNLLESELFGHERGAFTDAKSRKLGLVEQANGGTLFLDEMGEMDPGPQAKLLRFLEGKAFRRVGGNADLRADVRVVAATNADLPEAVAAGRFREDLYYRLAVLTVHLPALRERPEDVPLLARHFLVRFAARFDKGLREITPRAMKLLESHAWPGNIRELKNTIERATLLAQGEELDLVDLELTPAARCDGEEMKLPPAGVDLNELERALVRQALLRCRGNITRAGRLLNLSRDQVRYRVSKFGLQDELVLQRTS